MIAVKGNPIELTLQLTKDGVLFPGQSISVRVIRQGTATVDLPSTVVPEIDPGVYSYQWLTPPNTEVNMIAQYTINSKLLVGEEIQIISIEGGETRGSVNEIVGIIDDTDTLEGVMEDTLDLEGVIEDTIDLEGVIEQTEDLEGVIDDTLTLTGIVEDTR